MQTVVLVVLQWLSPGAQYQKDVGSNLSKQWMQIFIIIIIIIIIPTFFFYKKAKGILYSPPSVRPSVRLSVMLSPPKPLD